MSTEHRDPHTEVAARIFGVPIDQVTAQQRREAKSLNMRYLYGGYVPDEELAALCRRLDHAK